MIKLLLISFLFITKCDLERWLIKNHYQFTTVERVIDNFKIDTGEEKLDKIKFWVRLNLKKW